ncbi:hypothetical protein AMS62_19725 [Bacillus sp. FJAT-18019]|nr:hypothetical protein AMS62_19725 [Bacillus sp. FJAT-18019]
MAKIEIPMNNSAGRLYHIIDAIKLNHLHNSDPYAILAKVFNVSKDDKEVIIENYSELFRLTKTIKEDILHITNINHERYLQPINIVLDALSSIELNGSNGLNKFVNKIDDNVMTRLEFCSDTLSRVIGEHNISENELNELYNNINILIELVNNMQINNDLKALFLKNLTNIRLAIENYKLWGTKGLQSVIESSLGSILLRGDLVTSEEERSTGKKIVEYIFEINNIINAGKKIYETLEPVIKFFIGTGKDE